METPNYLFRKLCSSAGSWTSNGTVVITNNPISYTDLEDGNMR